MTHQYQVLTHISITQEYLSKPGGGAPLRTESGNPIGVVHVHPDIRNTREHLNEEAKKKTVVNGVAVPPPCDRELFCSLLFVHHKTYFKPIFNPF